MTFKNFDELLEVVRREKPKVGFASIVSNPPYQIEAGDSVASPNVYHHFAKVSHLLGDYVSMIHPARWMLGGQGEGMDDFRKSELNSKKYIKFFDLSTSKDVFTGVEIAGGLNYYLWSSKNTKSVVRMSYDGTEFEQETIGINGEVKARNPELSKIVQKIEVKEPLSKIISPMWFYGSNFNGTREVEALPVTLINSVDVFYIKGNRISHKSVSKSLTERDFSDYKVWVSKTANRSNGSSYPRPDRIFIGLPGQICSGSFLNIGGLSSKIEAENLLRYIKTNFCNFLTGITIPSHIMGRESHRLVPNVNFATGEIEDKPGTFLDFSKPATLDDQLAVIYDLTEDERNLMTKDLKPWRDKTSVTADM